MAKRIDTKSNQKSRRLSEALRANLKRRKDQRRGRAAMPEPPKAPEKERL